jgi:hypothetical protein
LLNLISNSTHMQYLHTFFLMLKISQLMYLSGLHSESVVMGLTSSLSSSTITSASMAAAVGLFSLKTKSRNILMVALSMSSLSFIGNHDSKFTKSRSFREKHCQGTANINRHKSHKFEMTGETAISLFKLLIRCVHFLERRKLKTAWRIFLNMNLLYFC